MRKVSRLALGIWLALCVSAAPAAALSGENYMQLDSEYRAFHVMGMVEAMKFTDDLTGGESLRWFFQCAGTWTGAQFETALTEYLQDNPRELNYRTPSLLVTAVGEKCPNTPMWAR